MAKPKTPNGPSSPETAPTGLDRTGAAAAQGTLARDGIGLGDPTLGDAKLGEDWAEGAVHRGRLRVRTLVTLRWLVVAGELALLLLVMALGFSLPYPLAFALVGAGAWVNLLTGVASPGQRV